MAIHIHQTAELAERGRARSAVALAPAGGWVDGDPVFEETMDFFETTARLVKNAAKHADRIASTAAGRRSATRFIVTEPGIGYRLKP